jgi:hypothetical protein
MHSHALLMSSLWCSKDFVEWFYSCTFDNFFLSTSLHYHHMIRCFTNDFALSNHSMNERFGLAVNSRKLFGFRYFFNWAMFAAPRHIVIKKSLEYSVQLIKREYFGNSGIKIFLNDHLGKMLQCTTTMTLTHVARELVLLNTTGLGLRVGETETHVFVFICIHTYVYTFIFMNTNICIHI